MLFYLLLIVSVSNCQVVDTSQDTANKLLLILFDGFRWNYFGNFSQLPNFDRFRTHGVHAEYMRPNFPSLSYPGYYSVLTGRYVESHGFVENTMYDTPRDMFFWTDTDTNGSMPFWWNYTDPFWTTTTKAKLRTFVYNWPGCHVNISDVVPTYYEKYEFYNDTEELQENIDAVVQKFSNDEADVGVIYTEYTDYVGHKFGPESDDMKMGVKQVDDAIGLLFNRLDRNQLTNKVNVILVSDHGMTDVSKATKIQIDSVINMDDVQSLTGYGSAVGVWPVKGKIEKVYQDLKNISDVYVWKRDEIPEELHYKHHYRAPTILVAAKPNVFFVPLVNNSKQYPPSDHVKSYVGYHGYLPSDSKDMMAIFLAHGPDFKSNYSAPPIFMVDVYNLLTHVVKIKGRPNNGTWGNVAKMLKSGWSDYAMASGTVLTSYLCITLTFLFTAYVFGLHR